jgi:uncharacterized membrane protein YqjE
MTSRNESPPTSNPFTLVRRLVSGGVALAKLEVQRGRQEMAQNLAHLRGGLLLLALAAALVVTFLVAFVAFIIALLVAGGLWWVALIVVLALLALAGLLGWSGIKRVQSTKFTPEETIASVKEEIAWAKTRLLRRE